MIDIEKIKSKINPLCHRLRVKRLDLFGSVLNQRFGPTSDIDVLVEFYREDGDLFNRYFELKEQLEIIFGRSVDLVTAESIRNPYFKMSIDRSRRNVYAA